MSEYSTYDTESGEFTRVYDLEKCLRTIRVRNNNNENRIKYLEEENRKLKEEYSQDEEIQKMQSELKKMKEDYWRGFPISKDEEEAVKEWKKKHDEEVHSLKTLDDRLRAGGCIGGRYTYHFVPTSIGTSGKVICNCGAEFEFQMIG